MPGFDPNEGGGAPVDWGTMRVAYGAPFAAAEPQAGPPQGWGPPEPVYMPMLVPLRGHPYVWCKSLPGPDFGWPPRPTWSIDCKCKACGRTYHRNCEFPPKSGTWIAMFAAEHCHGDEACRQAWTREHAMGLHRLTAAYPGEG
jgi:hypothetical protein